MFCAQVVYQAEGRLTGNREEPELLKLLITEVGLFIEKAAILGAKSKMVG